MAVVRNLSLGLCGQFAIKRGHLCNVTMKLINGDRPVAGKGVIQWLDEN